jgi:hypothetical protein
MLHFNTCVSCTCGAHYERAEVALPIKDVGIYECHHCGEVLERWHGKTVPQFRLLAAPQSKASSAA